MRGVWHAWEKRSAYYRLLIWKYGGKRRLGKSRSRWEDVRMDLGEVGMGGIYSIHLAQNRNNWWLVMNLVMNLWVP